MNEDETINLILKIRYMFGSKDCRVKPVINYNGSYLEGIECNNGWLDLIYSALNKIADIDTEKLFRVFCIKEKFGGLVIQCMFVDGNNPEYADEIYKIIKETLEKSYNVCEICGNNEASLRRGSYLVTLCDECNSKRN